LRVGGPFGLCKLKINEMFLIFRQQNNCLLPWCNSREAAMDKVWVFFSAIGILELH